MLLYGSETSPDMFKGDSLPLMWRTPMLLAFIQKVTERCSRASDGVSVRPHGAYHAPILAARPDCCLDQAL
eukprot:3017212-Amphidinium_carterae.1